MSAARCTPGRELWADHGLLTSSRLAWCALSRRGRTALRPNTQWYSRCARAAAARQILTLRGTYSREADGIYSMWLCIWIPRAHSSHSLEFCSIYKLGSRGEKRDGICTAAWTWPSRDEDVNVNLKVSFGSLKAMFVNFEWGFLFLGGLPTVRRISNFLKAR